MQIVFTCIRSWQVELRVGAPWSAAVTVKAYSARSVNLRGEAVLSSPVVGLMEKRSALEPEVNETNIINVCYVDAVAGGKICKFVALRQIMRLT